MPLYEYHCTSCGKQFELIRSFSQADEPAPCPSCHTRESKRAISRFAAHVRGSDGGTHSVSGSGGCTGCSRGSCDGCHH